jgi:hypothetical protein
MTTCFRRTCATTLAVLVVAFCCSPLMAQTTTDSGIEQRLQKLQDLVQEQRDMLKHQQQQINDLQKQNQDLKQVQKNQLSVSPVNLSSSASAQTKLTPAVYDASASQAVQAPAAPTPETPTIVPAVAPLRVLPIEAPKAGGLAPGIKLGPVTLTPYGFLKATAIRDSSNPQGVDFPIINGFPLTTGTGANGSSSFFIKARSSRFGGNFEWPDISKKLALTGRVEGDFEGNFNESANADVSSLRNPNPRLRLAYVRTDYHLSESTDFFFKAGQDWSLFGSPALPNLLETTFLGATFGDVYTRAPQMTFGWVQDVTKDHKVKIMPEFGIMMPSSGQILKLGTAGITGQISQAEDEGALSGRPEIEGRFVVQFQADNARGVAPAQVFIDGFQGYRQSIVSAGTAGLPTGFTGGFTGKSEMYGAQIGFQLPTRWITLTASAYEGGDLRFYAGGQLNTYFTNLAGLSAATEFPTTDGGPMALSGGQWLGCSVAAASLAACPAANIVNAPEKPVRSFGGFINAGFPISRWFNANPNGHNAGWQAYLTFGKDQVVHSDQMASVAANLGAPLAANASQLNFGTSMGKMAIATVYYKLNKWATFGFEQSIYANRGVCGTGVSALATAAGIPTVPGNPNCLAYTIGSVNGAPRYSNEIQDHRTEFGPIFTF